MSARWGWGVGRALVAAAAVGLLAGCPSDLGERCAGDDECAGELLCRKPAGGAIGICDYPYRTAGEPCTVAGQCDPALTCSSHFEAGARYGVCVEKQPAGQPCSVNRDCASGRCSGATPEALGACAP